jgi:hypothetical protein
VIVRCPCALVTLILLFVSEGHALGDEHNQAVEPGTATSAAVLAGAVAGTAISTAWILRDQAKYAPADQWSGRTQALLLAGGAAAGSLIGLATAKLRGTTPGRAAFAPTAAILTATAAGLIAAAATTSDKQADDVGLLTAALTIEASMIASSYGARALDPSTEDVAWMGLGATVVALLAGGFSALAGDGDLTSNRGVWAASAGGLVLGGATAILWSRGRPR